MANSKLNTRRYGTWFFVATCAVVAWMCYYVALDTCLGGVGFVFAHGRACAAALASALLLLSPYWLLPGRWRWLVWLPLTLVMLWCLMQVCYCRAYNDLMPLQSLTLTSNVNATLWASAVDLLRWRDLLLVAPFASLVVLCLFGGHDNASASMSLKWFFMSLACCLLMTAIAFVRPGENYSKRFLHNFSNREYFALNGLIPHGVYSLYQAVFNSHAVTDDERARVMRFLTMDCPKYEDNRFATTAGRNLVLIIVESLHSWPIGMDVDGREVTPVINRLVQGDSVIFAPHMLFQTSHGHSSDAHFIYNTGLLPLRDGVVAVHHGDGPYPSLAAALRGYDCREVICTPGMNWNQSVTARSYGFDSLYVRDDLQRCGALARHDGIDDAALIDFTADLVPRLRQPFFLEMVTMTMHAPYPKDKLPTSWITAADTLTAQARSYLNCVHLTDSCIGVFLNRLRELGLSRNTIVAIVSDHTQLYLNRIKGMTDYEAVPNDWGIPLIITGCDTTLRRYAIMGQVDVFPTLLDVMGANAYPWKGLGHSILRYPVQSAIQPGNMSVLGDSTGLTPHQRRAWDISRLLIFDRATSLRQYSPIGRGL